MIDTSAEDLAAALDALAARTPFGKVVITGMKDSERAAKELGAEVRELPV
jgi:hypothetical protein